jgi:hypothetical protein
MDMAIQGETRATSRSRTPKPASFITPGPGEFRFDSNGYLLDTTACRPRLGRGRRDGPGRGHVRHTLSTSAATGSVTDILIDDLYIAGQLPAQ